MIITEKTTIRVNINNIRHLELKGFKNLKINEFIEIDVNDLSKNSAHLINVKCDICGKEKLLKYRRYLKSYNNGGYYSCSNSCNINKRKIKYTNELTEKRKETCLEKYGVDSYSKTDEYKKKIKETCLKKYGVENVFQNEKIKEKIKGTCLEKYGFDNPSKSKDIKIKKEVTCLMNHGVKSPCQNISIFEKNLKSGLKIKKFRNTELNYQGSYELDFLNIFYDKIEIKKGLTIKYKIKNKTKYYHSDYYIPSVDLIVEIKSTYWYNKCKELNSIKEKNTKKYHNYIIILDKNYDNFLKIINN